MDTVQKDWQMKVFEGLARRSPRIISLFHFFYWVFAIFIVVLAYLEFTDPQLFDSLYKFGKNLGEAAISLLGLVVMPGILGRFKIEIRLTRIITLFRRQIGITIFLLALGHYLLVKSVPSFQAGVVMPLANLLLFEIFGLAAFSILFFMFLTSNNTSVKKLGPWWKRLHRFVYVALWLLVLHTALQKISVWSAGIFTVAVLEVASLVYDYLKKRGLNKVGSNPTSRGDSSTS